MAFDINRFTRVSSAYNAGRILTTFNPSETPVYENGPGIFSYASSVDTISTISAANYFSDVVYDLAVSDIIIAVGTNASNMLQVVAVNRDAGTITVGGFTASGSVDTANIVDGAIINSKVNAAAAIDFSKLATLASGNILVGSAGGVATSTVMSGDATIIASGAISISKNLIQHVRTTLTAAQWNGMYATPVLLLANQGAGTQIVVHNVTAVMTYVAAQYAAGGAVVVQYDSTANGAGTQATGTIAAATINGLAASSTFQLQGAQAAAANTTVQNKGIYISNQTGAFTTGDSTWVVDMWYSVKAA
jgi:hypothetical protein